MTIMTNLLRSLFFYIGDALHGYIQLALWKTSLINTCDLTVSFYSNIYMHARQNSDVPRIAEVGYLCQHRIWLKIFKPEVELYTSKSLKSEVFDAKALRTKIPLLYMSVLQVLFFIIRILHHH